MNYYILCTASVASGGQELAHQCCYELKLNEQDARMYYVDNGQTEPVDVGPHPKFEKYQTDHVASFTEVDREGNVVIVPEGLTDWAFAFYHATVLVWWMSVDNFTHLGDDRYIRGLNELTSIHLIQSEYAGDYLKKHGISEDKIMWLSDYIGEMYGQFVLPAEYRKNRVVYNPKKGYEQLLPLIDMCPEFEWVPLINMTEEEMILNMQLAKVYVDFGNHPGKDRIPREAVVCGCLVVTNRKGSAAYYGDVPIADEYKLSDPIDYDIAAGILRNLISGYSVYFDEFNTYRNAVKAEKMGFSEDVKKLIEKNLYFFKNRG